MVLSVVAAGVRTTVLGDMWGAVDRVLRPLRRLEALHLDQQYRSSADCDAVLERLLERPASLRHVSLPYLGALQVRARSFPWRCGARSRLPGSAGAARMLSRKDDQRGEIEKAAAWRTALRAQRGHQPCSLVDHRASPACGPWPSLAAQVDLSQRRCGWHSLTLQLHAADVSTLARLPLAALRHVRIVGSLHLDSDDGVGHNDAAAAVARQLLDVGLHAPPPEPQHLPPPELLNHDGSGCAPASTHHVGAPALEVVPAGPPGTLEQG